MILTISVTSSHIMEGRIKSCSNCPVALAIQQHLKKGKVFVGKRTFDIWIMATGSDKIVVQSQLLPKSAQDLIYEFDYFAAHKALADAAPYNFQIDIPEELLT